MIQTAAFMTLMESATAPRKNANNPETATTLRNGEKLIDLQMRSRRNGKSLQSCEAEDVMTEMHGTSAPIGAQVGWIK
jgi:hypothetical protein